VRGNSAASVVKSGRRYGWLSAWSDAVDMSAAAEAGISQEMAALPGPERAALTGVIPMRRTRIPHSLLPR